MLIIMQSYKTAFIILIMDIIVFDFVFLENICDIYFGYIGGCTYRSLSNINSSLYTMKGAEYNYDVIHYKYKSDIVML